MRDPIISTRSREKIVADTRAELDGWIDERAADLVARGMPPDAARQRALEEFGDVEGAVRYAQRQDVAADAQVRALLWIEELRSDLRIAARTLARTPTVTAVVLLTFALGIGATTAVFSVVHAMLLRRLPYGVEETLVYLPAVDNGVITPGLGGARHSARSPLRRGAVRSVDRRRRSRSATAGRVGGVDRAGETRYSHRSSQNDENGIVMRQATIGALGLPT